MTEIIEMIDDFKLNQEIWARKLKYIEICMHCLIRRKGYMFHSFSVEKVEDVT